MSEILQFTLGPVQGFVAQARRTRDFWSGSFILSYLTGKAIQAVIEVKGKIIFPSVQDDPLLQAIRSVDSKKGLTFPESFPVIGSIPNRFMAEVPEDFSGKYCVNAVNAAWQEIANEIWDKYIASVADYGNGCQEIWERQVNGFWDMSWVMGAGSDLLDRRKNWRSYIPPEEPGDKCTLMGNWQELSGHLRIHDRKAQNRFWIEFGKRVPGNDFHSNERLCAIALIKRLFPRIFRPNGISFPSTSYLAAVPWLTDLTKDQKEREKAIAFKRVARKELKGKENPAPFFQKCEDAELWDFLSLEGTCLFSSTLSNDELWNPSTKACRRHILKLLNNFKDQPAPFYGLLLMDGDRLGALLSEGEGKGRTAVSEAVNEFSSQVDSVIKSHNGLTIYAGGDDVLALLPLDKTLPAASELRSRYMKAFSDFNRPEFTTISAAIVYAHHHAPLKKVIAKAHQLLDEDAKKKTGRDALAVAVWKTGGPVLNWSAPWEVKNQNGELMSVDVLLNKMVMALKNKQLTNSWIYNIRKILQNPRGSDFTVPDGIDPLKLLSAELMHSREITMTPVQAEEVVNNLITLCCHQWRDNDKKLQRDDSKFSLDGALLVKFLVTKGAVI